MTNGRTRAPLVTWSEHGGDRFVAPSRTARSRATQFHPEKSGDAGAPLLRNWVGTLAVTGMSKERARRRAEREREQADQGGRPRRRGRNAAERRDARRRAVTGWLPRPPLASPACSRPGVAASVSPRPWRSAGRAQRRALGRHPRLGEPGSLGVIVSLLAAPVLHVMLFRRAAETRAAGASLPTRS